MDGDEFERVSGGRKVDPPDSGEGGLLTSLSDYTNADPLPAVTGSAECVFARLSMCMERVG